MTPDIELVMTAIQAIAARVDALTKIINDHNEILITLKGCPSCGSTDRRWMKQLETGQLCRDDWHPWAKLMPESHGYMKIDWEKNS